MVAVPDKSGAWSLGESVLWYNPTPGSVNSTWSLGESIILDELYIGSNVYVKVAGAWKQAVSVYVKVAGAWKAVSTVGAKVGGVWKS